MSLRCKCFCLGKLKRTNRISLCIKHEKREKRDESTAGDSLRPNSSVPSRRPSIVKLEHELAGGIEDWEDVNGGDVDRYGFITVRKDTSDRSGNPELKPPQRVSTVSILSILVIAGDKPALASHYPFCKSSNSNI